MKKVNVDCRFWDDFKNLDCVKVSREHAFLWINFAANMTATSNHGKMTLRYQPFDEKLYGSGKKGDFGNFQYF